MISRDMDVLADRVSFTRDFTSLPVHDGVFDLIAGHVLTANGLEKVGAGTAMAGFAVGGFNDVEMVCKFQHTGTAGAEDMGPVFRFQTLIGSDDTFYWARVLAGTAYLMRVLDGAYVSIAQDTFALPADELCTVTARCVGSNLGITFEAATPGLVPLAAVDSNIVDGSAAFLTFSGNSLVEEISVAQL